MSNVMTSDQRRALLAAVLGGIVETVQEVGPQGAPAGVLYAALNARGMSLDTFNQVMGALVSAGRLRKAGFLYYAVEAKARVAA